MYKQNLTFFYRNDYDENPAENYRVVNIKCIHFFFYTSRSLFFKRLANNKGPIRLTTVVGARARAHSPFLYSFQRCGDNAICTYTRVRSKTVLYPFLKRPVEDVRTLIYFVPNDSFAKIPRDVDKLCVFLIRLGVKIVFRKITQLYGALLSASYRRTFTVLWSL